MNSLSWFSSSIARLRHSAARARIFETLEPAHTCSRARQSALTDLEMSDSDTASEVDFELPVAKRRRISNSAPAQTSQSRSRSISPPPLRRGISPQGDLPRAKSSGGAGALSNGAVNAPTLIPSPFQLTQIRDLRSEDNVDTVSLKDILGDPLIKETWQFNYLIDLDFLMCVAGRSYL